MNLRNPRKLARRDYLRRLASMKEQPQENPCRSWIAMLTTGWHTNGSALPQFRSIATESKP